MPILDEHKEVIKVPHADMNNIAQPRHPWGGCCVAAAFLSMFVEGETKWAHIDMAGPSMNPIGSGKAPICNGNTGFGASLLLTF